MGLVFLFPPLCVSCGAQIGEPYSLCGDCWKEISFVGGAICQICGLPFEIDPGEGAVCAGCYAEPTVFDCARSVFHYDEVSKRLILGFKHGDRLERAPAFIHWLERVGRPLAEEADIIVPVPLHPSRLWRRRYNQSAVLAIGIERRFNKIYAPQALERVRATPSQGEMPSAKARARNVAAALRVPDRLRHEIARKNILLLDDVYTTGATLNACARALRAAGAARIGALTLARVVRPRSGAI
nr:MAG: ComF family protein [Hyphomicrobiales bacterium]